MADNGQDGNGVLLFKISTFDQMQHNFTGCSDVSLHLKPFIF